MSVGFILFFCSLCFAKNYEKISESGFGNIDNRYAWAMCKFTPDTGDDAERTFLYVGTRNGERDGVGELHRMDIETEGWEAVTTTGFGNKTNKGIRNLIVYENKYGKALYAVTWSSRRGAQIFASKTGDRFTWSRVMENGFGNKKNIGILSVIEYNGYLYCGTGNAETGCSLYRSNDLGNSDS